MLFRGSSYEMPKVKKNYLLVNLYLSIVIQKKKIGQRGFFQIISV